ncbi:MAG TPA: YlxR family protein [Actinomycetota bacterium]|nr:YlxR family protein [Actinomycetota bacterium]
MSARREPERTCVGCRTKARKADLLRIVRGPDAMPHVDPTGSLQGRGAYVHRSQDCARAALAKGTLGRALRTGLGPEEVARLGREIEGALQG